MLAGETPEKAIQAALSAADGKIEGIDLGMGRAYKHPFGAAGVEARRTNWRDQRRTTIMDERNELTKAISEAQTIRNMGPADELHGVLSGLLRAVEILAEHQFRGVTKMVNQTTLREALIQAFKILDVGMNQTVTVRDLFMFTDMIDERMAPEVDDEDESGEATMEQEQSAETFPDALVERLARLSFDAQMHDDDVKALAGGSWEAYPPRLKASGLIGLRAILAELASMPCELPEHAAILQAMKDELCGWGPEKAVEFTTKRIAHFLAAKDAERERLNKACLEAISAAASAEHRLDLANERISELNRRNDAAALEEHRLGADLAILRSQATVGAHNLEQAQKRIAELEKRTAELESASAEAIATYFDPLSVTREGFDKLELLLPDGLIDRSRLQNARTQSLQRLQARISHLDKSVVELEKRLEFEQRQRMPQYPKPKTPEQLVSLGKPFPAIGQTWRFDGNDMAPPTSGDVVTSLRWFHGRPEVVFGDGSSVGGFEHLMENDAWKCTRSTPVDANGKTPGQIAYEAFSGSDEPLEWHEFTSTCRDGWEAGASAVLHHFGNRAEVLKRVRVAVDKAQSFDVTNDEGNNDYAVLTDEVFAIIDAELSQLPTPNQPTDAAASALQWVRRRLASNGPISRVAAIEIVDDIIAKLPPAQQPTEAIVAALKKVRDRIEDDGRRIYEDDSNAISVIETACAMVDAEIAGLKQ